VSDVCVSWILPVYNAESYVGKTIESILSQDFQDWELIIINDGSKDNSDAVINKYTDARILYISRENKGLAATLNQGIALSKGEYIARIDADDLCHPQRLTKQIRFMETHKDVVLVGCNVRYIDHNGNVLGYSSSCIGSNNIREKLKQDNCIFHPSVLIRKNALVKVGCYDERIGCYWEDYALWILLLEEGKFYILSEHLLDYRIHMSSISSRTPKLVQNYMREFSLQKSISDASIVKFHNEIQLYKKNNVTRNKVSISQPRRIIKSRILAKVIMLVRRVIGK